MKLADVPRAVWWAVVAGLLWVVALVTGIATEGPPWLTAAASVGDAFAPIAAIATIAALVVAFEQAHVDREQIRQDRLDAERDRLARVYSTWLPKARELVETLLHHAQEGEQHGNRYIRDVDMPGAANSLVGLRDKIYFVRRQLRESITEVLVFEGDAERRKNLAFIVRKVAPPTARVDLGEDERKEFLSEWSSVTSDFRKRQQVLATLQADVTAKLGAGAHQDLIDD
jgi:hypothetical protein